jgi:ABC-type taurine transport system ATPase subunit
VTAFVTFDAVAMQYGSGASLVRALDRVSLSFEAGDFVCIVGPSGCGKTTLLQMLAGFLTPTEGSVRFAGKPVAGPAPDRGVVFQQANLFPWMNVAANASFGPKVRGEMRNGAAVRVERLLRTTGLWDFRARYPYELSGGMQQRLAIVRALANEPKLLLMDEPFGALDALTRERMQEELHDIWRRTAMTVLFVTHSVEEAVYLGTRVVVMSPRPGRIVKNLELPFARQLGDRNSRHIKASPEFVAARETILSVILESADHEQAGSAQGP